jgi:hypothetical protein
MRGEVAIQNIEWISLIYYNQKLIGLVGSRTVTGFHITYRDVDAAPSKVRQTELVESLMNFSHSQCSHAQGT